LLDGVDGVLAELLFFGLGTELMVVLTAGDEELEYRREGFLGVRGKGDVTDSLYPGRIR